MITVTITVSQDRLEQGVPSSTTWTHWEGALPGGDARYHADDTQYAVIRATAAVLGYLRPHVELRAGSRVAGAAGDLIGKLESKE